MGNDNSGIGKALVNGLRLSSDAQFERDKRKEADRADYRRKYWQGYAKRVKRVFGAITLQEYADLKKRAEAGGRSIWGQVWAESCAYCKNTIVPTQEIAQQQRQLISELRRIGNNINQLAKIGHIEARKHGGLGSRANDHIGTETLRQFAKLEAAVARFGQALSGDGHDH